MEVPNGERKNTRNMKLHVIQFLAFIVLYFIPSCEEWNFLFLLFFQRHEEWN